LISFSWASVAAATAKIATATISCLLTIETSASE
jgi:hypothetical protein